MDESHQGGEAGEATLQAVEKSVVTVMEINLEKKYSDYCSGFVLGSNAHDTFILTASFLVKSEWSTLKVYFAGGGKVGHTAAAIYVGQKFSILKVKRVEGAEPVRWREHDAGRESAFVLAPVGSFDALTMVTAFVAAPTCKEKDCKLNPVKKSNNYLAINCCFHDEGHHSKSRLISAPVFDKDGNCLGIVHSDFGPAEAKGLFSPAVNKKLVLRASCVHHLLNKLVGKDNWQQALVEYRSNRRFKKTGAGRTPAKSMKPSEG